MTPCPSFSMRSIALAQVLPALEHARREEVSHGGARVHATQSGNVPLRCTLHEREKFAAVCRCVEHHGLPVGARPVETDRPLVGGGGDEVLSLQAG